MEIRELASEQVATITPTETLAEAAHRMDQNHVGDLVVVEDGEGPDKPVGIITDRDLVRALARSSPDSFQQRPVHREMSEAVVLAQTSDTTDEVLQNMRDNGIRRVPLIDGDDALVGIVTFDDFVGYFGDGLMKMAELVQQEITREVTAGA